MKKLFLVSAMIFGMSLSSLAKSYPVYQFRQSAQIYNQYGYNHYDNRYYDNRHYGYHGYRLNNVLLPFIGGALIGEILRQNNEMCQRVLYDRQGRPVIVEVKC